MTLLSLLSVVAVNATEWQAKTDTVWAGRHYREVNGIATGYSESDSWITWNYDEGTMVVYAVHLPSGHVRADIVLSSNSGSVVTLNVRIVHPATNTVVIDHAVKSQPGRTSKQTIEILPDTELAADGWYRIEFTSPDARNTLTQLTCLTFQRESRYAVTAANSMMAPAVHLWWSTTDPKAPKDDSFDWVYMEALIPEVFKQSCTYQMTIGSSGLYSGIQTNHLLNDDSWTHAVIFSAWDSGDVDVDKTLPDYMRSGALDVGEGAYAVRFGGEGTGASLRYPEGQRWQTDHWVQMLLNERPDYVETTSVEADGTKKVSPFRSTLLSMWYKQAEETSWHYFGTLRMAGNYRMEGNNSGLYSFLENWSGFGGDLYRRVYYRNGSLRSTASGQWYSLNKAGFSSTQKDVRNSRNDYGHGVTTLYDNSLYLETGGFLGVRDSANSFHYVAQGEMPWVDTIDVQALRERVDLAVVRNNNKDIRMKIESTRVVSDPDTWQLISFSDEETVGEGDYGRASQIMDGNTSTYYRNQYRSSYVGFPHTFVFDAQKPYTITSIGLYQSQDLNHRAKLMQLFISDDGDSWTSVGRFTFEEDEAPTITLPKPVTARYYRCRFLTGHGDGHNLAINEIYFKNEYRLNDMKQLAAQLLAQEDCFSGYVPEALADLRSVYDEGRVADIEALRGAIARLGETAQPLTWGLVDKNSHITSFSAYQLHNKAGWGDLVADENGQLTISGAVAETSLDAYQQPTRVSEANNNWLILRSETYSEYYFYNLGAKKFLNLQDAVPTLSDKPQHIALLQRTGGYFLGERTAHIQLEPSAEDAVTRSAKVNDGSIFELRNNYAVSPVDQEVRQLLKASEEALHGQVDGIGQPCVSQPSLLRTNVTIHNLQGVQVYRGRYESIPLLPAGVYVMQSGSFVKKMVLR